MPADQRYTFTPLFDDRRETVVERGLRPEAAEVIADRTPSHWYVFDDAIRLRLNLALATGRPLLVRGPSGSGKSSLARAVAARAKWNYKSGLVGSRTQAQDLADVVRSLARCGGATDPDVVNAILDALGWPTLSRARETIGTPYIQARAIHPGETEYKDDEAEDEDGGMGDSSSRERGRGHAKRSAVPSSLRVLVTPSPPEEDRAEIRRLPLPKPKEHRPLYDTPIEPLLEPHLARAMLGRLSAVRLPRGELDVAALVTAIARANPPCKLPRRPLSTLGPGLRLLVDTSPAMRPFHEDAVQLFRELKRTVGADRIEVRNFEQCPAYGVIEKRTRRRTPYSPPRAGTPVLAVTDLGVVRAETFERAHRTRDWLAFRRHLMAQGVPLSVLSPYPGERLGDGALVRLLRIVLWDRETGVRQVPPAPFVRGFDD